LFNIGDKVVYPMHGAGVIESIEEREILGLKRDYYVMNLSIGEMKVMIPLDNAFQVGLREVISREELEKVYNILKEPYTTSTSNWNRRYSGNLEKIKTGNILEIAEVVKNLFYREKEKGLSAGEKKMLESAKRMLLSEIIMVDDLEEKADNELIDGLFAETLKNELFSSSEHNYRV